MTERPSTETIRQERSSDFEDRVVSNFLKKLGYDDIVKEPKCGSGEPDYLVHYAKEKFFVEAHSPDLTKNGPFELETQLNLDHFEGLVSRKVKEKVPEVYEHCCLYLDCNGLLRRQAYGREVKQGIIKELRKWRDRISELPTYSSDESYQYSQYEDWLDEYLELLGISIPYPYGSLVIPHTSRRTGKETTCTIQWRLLRRHDKYGPHGWRCLRSGGGGVPTANNVAKGIKTKIEQHRDRIKGDLQLDKIPFVVFLDGRSCRNLGRPGDFFDLGVAFIRDAEWHSKTPDAVVLVGLWGVPSKQYSFSKEAEELSGDMIFNPRKYRSGRRYPSCFQPFLQRCAMVRLWSVREHLSSVHRIQEVGWKVSPRAS